MIATVPITTNCPRCAALVGGEPDPTTGNLLCAACGSQFDPRQSATAASSSAPPAMWQPQSGDFLAGGYSLVKELGRGGMATVWQARQERLSRDVAVKILHAHLSGDAELRRRFLREAEAMVQLDHPHIVPVLDRGEHGERPFLVTALVGPRTLRNEMADGRLQPDRVATVAQQILSGLAHAHERGLIHRDIKPENLLITDDGKVHIADFGIAQVARSLDGHTLTQLTGTNVIMGTIAYMAPEQSEARNFIDHRCDLYSVGVVCYEALVGHRPVGRFEDPSSTLQLPAILAKLWDTFIFSLLERNPEKRPQNAQAALLFINKITELSTLYINTVDHNLLHIFNRRLISTQAELADVGIKISLGELDNTINKSHAADIPIKETLPLSKVESQKTHRIDDPKEKEVDEESYPHGRKLMRANDDMWIGGLLSGFARWAGIHPGWVRLGALISPFFVVDNFWAGVVVFIACYVGLSLFIPRCPQKKYTPRPLNATWPKRGIGGILGVCDLLGRITALPAWAWRIIAIFALPFGSLICYVALGIFLPRLQAEEPHVHEFKRKENDHNTDDGSMPTQVGSSSYRFWIFLAATTGIAALIMNSNLTHFSTGTTTLWWITGIATFVALFSARHKPAEPQAEKTGGNINGILVGIGLCLTLLIIGPDTRPPIDNMSVHINGIPANFVTSNGNSTDPFAVELDPANSKYSNSITYNNTPSAQVVNNQFVLIMGAIFLAAFITLASLFLQNHKTIFFSTAGFIGVGSIALITMSPLNNLFHGVSFSLMLLAYVTLSCVIWGMTNKLLQPLGPRDEQKTIAPTLIGIATLAGMAICAMPLLSSIDAQSISFQLPSWMGIAAIVACVFFVVAMAKHHAFYLVVFIFIILAFVTFLLMPGTVSRVKTITPPIPMESSSPLFIEAP